MNNSKAVYASRAGFIGAIATTIVLTYAFIANIF